MSLIRGTSKETRMGEFSCLNFILGLPKQGDYTLRSSGALTTSGGQNGSGGAGLVVGKGGPGAGLEPRVTWVKSKMAACT